MASVPIFHDLARPSAPLSGARRRVTAARTAATGATVAGAVVLVALALVSLVGLRGPGLPGTGPARSVPALTTDAPGRDASGLDDRDGYLAVGASLSPSSDAPAVARLDSDLRVAVRRASEAARADGVELRVNSGWRSAQYQRELLRRAVVTYGSVAVARQYVRSPAESSHVTGEAVDLGPLDGQSWLSQHGSEYGLCQTLANERWHYELATQPGGVCPAMATDAAAG